MQFKHLKVRIFVQLFTISLTFSLFQNIIENVIRIWNGEIKIWQGNELVVFRKKLIDILCQLCQFLCALGFAVRWILSRSWRWEETVFELVEEDRYETVHLMSPYDSCYTLKILAVEYIKQRGIDNAKMPDFAIIDDNPRYYIVHFFRKENSNVMWNHVYGRCTNADPALANRDMVFFKKSSLLLVRQTVLPVCSIGVLRN